MGVMKCGYRFVVLRSFWQKHQGASHPCYVPPVLSVNPSREVTRQLASQTQRLA